MNNLFDIIEYTNNTNNHYNTSGFSFYLYGLIKMIKPLTVIELGTGVGTTCFLAAQACKENNKGKVITVDNGQDYIHSKFNINVDFERQKKQFELSNFLELRQVDINLNTLADLDDVRQVDILFNDIDCAPHYALTVLSWLLPRVKDECYFIIDRAATFWPTYCAIELTLSQLNHGKIPKVLLDAVEDKQKFKNLVDRFRFSVQYVLKNDDIDDEQDSFAVIKIEENNIGYRMI